VASRPGGSGSDGARLIGRAQELAALELFAREAAEGLRRGRAARRGRGARA
jgi:hypothetical protein